jgi:hypothetical protein
MQGLGVLCPLDNFTIEHDSEHKVEAAMKATGFDYGLARRREPGGTEARLSEKRRSTV